MKRKLDRNTRTKLDLTNEVADALSAYDELRARVADIEALAHAAHNVVLPWVANRGNRRDVGRLGVYIDALAKLAREAVDESEVVAAKLMHGRARRRTE